MLMKIHRKLLNLFFFIIVLIGHNASRLYSVSIKYFPFQSIGRFRLVLSPQPTPATLYLLQRCKWARAEETAGVNQVEVCPKAIDLTQAIANRISTDGGGALIIDYGLNGIVLDSLQVCFYESLHATLIE